MQRWLVVFLCLVTFIVSAGYYLKRYLANPDNYVTRGCSPVHVEGKGFVCGDQSMEDWVNRPGEPGRGLGNTV